MLIQLGLCVLYVAIMTWGFQNYYYNHDFFFYTCNAESSKNWFDFITVRDFDSRYRPLFFLLFKVEYLLFGLSQTGYLILSLLFHCANCFGVYFLCRRLTNSIRTSLIASVLFLSSSLCWSAVLDIISISRHSALFLYILGVISFLKSIRQDSFRLRILAIACFVAGLLMVEEVVTYPAILLVAAMLFREAFSQKKTLATLGCCFILSAIFLITFKLTGVGSHYSLHYGWHSLQKLLTMPREILQHLFIPRRDWGLPNSLFLRSLPALLILAPTLYLLFGKRDKTLRTVCADHKSLSIFAALWIFITVLPYLSRPSGWTWFSRYFYFPSVGVFILTGIGGALIYHRLCNAFSSKILAKILSVAVLSYLVIFGVFTTISINQNIYLGTTRSYVVGKQEARQLFGLLCELTSLKLAPSDRIGLIAHNAPFPSKRLETLLEHYIGSGIVSIFDNTAASARSNVPMYETMYRKGHWEKITPLSNASANQQ